VFADGLRQLGLPVGLRGQSLAARESGVQSKG
jgi:hypothetical protein